MKAFQRKRKLNNTGFTLMEMIVVLIIMVIMLSLSAVGIMAWQDWSKMKQLNANAEAIFIAAQTQLSEYAASGSLESEVIGKIKNGDGYYSGVTQITAGNIGSLITDPDGNEYVWDQMWTSGKASQGTVVSVSGVPGDYQNFLEGKLDDPGKVLLYKLITSYISDKSILNDSSIIIEFSPDAAQVLAVCYSSSADKLSYDDSGVCVRDRSESTRNDLMFGYYGVKTLSMPIKGKTESILNLTAGTVDLRNEEILDIIYVPDAEDADVIFGTGKKTAFSVEVYDPDIAGDDTKVMTLEFEIDNSDPLPAGMKLAQGENAREVKAIYYPSGAEKTFRVPMWVELTARGDRAIRIALDAADVQAQSITLATALGLDTGDTVTAEDKENAEKAFRKTYSFYRFGLDADRIYIKLQVKDTADAAGEELFSGETNHAGEYVTFDSVTRQNGDEAEYKISNGRHLYNLRFVEDYADKIEDIVGGSSIPQGDLQYNKDWHQKYHRTFKLIRNIDWRNFVAYKYMGSSVGENYFFDSYYGAGTEGDPGIGIGGFETETIEFPSFRQLNYGDTFTAESDTEDNYSISNLLISTDANERFGVYGLSAQNLNRLSLSKDKSERDSNFDKLEFERAKGKHPTGLFAYNFGTITDLTLAKHKVFGSYKVGGFVGENLGTLSGLYLKNEENTSGVDNAEETFINKIENLMVVVPHFNGSNKDGDTYYYQFQYGRYEDDSALLKNYLKNELFGRNTSFVVGIHDVGGICGYQKYSNTEAPSVSYNALVNEAQVAGHSYLGGIIGRSIVRYGDGKTDRYTVTDLNAGGNHLSMNSVAFYENENYGRIQALPIYDYYGNTHNDGIDKGENANQMKAYYIGGICGMACDNTPDDGKLTIDYDKLAVRFVGCTSYWLYSDEEINRLISGEKDGFSSMISELRGSYVGGFTGFARMALFENCSSSMNEARDNRGNAYIFGCHYVGGYAGAMQACGFINDEGYTVNTANVIGQNMVGGIAGIIGTPKFKDNNYFTPKTLEGLERWQYDTWKLKLDQPEQGQNSSSGNIDKVLNTGLTFATGGENGMALKGWVGGICGYNGEKISNCSSLLDPYSKQMMLKLIGMTAPGKEDKFICNYSGGLVGYDSMTINYNGVGTSEINTIVYGDSYVGGAAGAADVDNGDGRYSSVNNCYFVDAGSDNLIDVEDKTGFRGSYILAAQDYAGGICGMAMRAGIKNQLVVDGDFIVHGKNYVGGYVGYLYGYNQNVACRIRAELVAKDSGIQAVRADGFFAGGIVGAVTRQAADGSSSAIKSGVTEVRAKYFAGGYAGVVLTTQCSSGLDKEIAPPSLYKVDNSNMYISADVAAGGYCGFYEISSESWSDGPVELYKYITGEAETADIGRVMDVLNAFDSGRMKVSGLAYSDGAASVSDHDGLNGGKAINNLKLESLTVNAGTVCAQYYAGGLLGYVPDAQSLYIRHENTCKVITTTDDTYTYAGGIIGKTGSRMVLDYCSNMGLITSNSYYFGNLCELNLGTISNGDVGYAVNVTDESSAFGYIGHHEFVGGLCGRNAEGGRITGYFEGIENKSGYGNETEDFDVKGGMITGGLCGQNDGTIYVSAECRYVIAAYGEDYGGGICGLNTANGKILYSGDGISSTLNTEGRKIRVRGKYAGLIAGRNEGLISGITIDRDVKTELYAADTADEAGAAGAFAGLNAGRIENCVNKAAIINVRGSAAGIAGAAEGAVFAESINMGNINAPDIAAGIVAVRAADGNISITNCRNYGTLVNGTKYGITGIADASVNSCLEAGGCNTLCPGAIDAANNYCIYDTLSDITHTDKQDLTFDGGETYTAETDGAYISKVSYTKDGEDITVSENIAIAVDKDVPVTLYDIFEKMGIDTEDPSVEKEEGVIYHIEVIVPATKKNLDKSDAVTNLSAYKAEDGTYSLCFSRQSRIYYAAVDGTMISGLDFNPDPLTATKDNDWVGKMEEKIYSILR